MVIPWMGELRVTARGRLNMADRLMVVVLELATRVLTSNVSVQWGWTLGKLFGMLSNQATVILVAVTIPPRRRYDPFLNRWHYIPKSH